MASAEPENKTYIRFMEWLDTWRPFSFSRFNDGEMIAIMQSAKRTARGNQKVSKALSDALIRAIQYKQGEYWLGMPCVACFPREHAEFKRLAGTNPCVTRATVFCNGGRWPMFLRDSLRLWKKRAPTHVFVHAASGIDSMRAIFGRYTVPVWVNSRDAFDDYDLLVAEVRRIARTAPEPLVLFACGPLANVLVHEGAMENPNGTWLDVGSVYDPLLLDVWHNCHLGTGSKCPVCNP